MTKEELEKEAEEYVSKYQGWGWTPHKGSAVYYAMLNSYIDSAEPREKRIAELEKENAELKADNDARKFAMAMSEKVEKQLREENAELKETVIKMNNVITETFSNLSKAKELLERLLITSCNSDVLNLLPNCSEVLRVRVEAEQFIKDSEVEKCLL